MFNQWYPITMSLPNCYLHEMEQLGKDIGNGYPLVKHVIPYWCVSSFTCLTWYLLPTERARKEDTIMLKSVTSNQLGM